MNCLFILMYGNYNAEMNFRVCFHNTSYINDYIYIFFLPANLEHKARYNYSSKICFSDYIHHISTLLNILNLSPKSILIKSDAPFKIKKVKLEV